jgi:hypothetical protein
LNQYQADNSQQGISGPYQRYFSTDESEASHQAMATGEEREWSGSY